MSILKTAALITILLLLSLNLNAQSFSKTASLKPLLTQEGHEKHWCPVCGMNLKMFYKTNHTSKLQDTTPRHYCSMRCLVVDMAKHAIELEDIKVVDASSEELIDAAKAFYVIGSKVKGTMSKVSKLAFKEKKDALDFVSKYSGAVVDLKVALEFAEKSLNSDIAMIQKKKEKKIYPMGQKIFQKMCSQDIDATEYTEINELKSAIKNEKLCKPLKEKQLQALSLYLWEVKRSGDIKSIDEVINVTKDEKCPICGMFVYKYPKWAAQIFYEDKHFSFDGVKDLMKYYFDNKNGISKIVVTDYYSQKAIDAKKAYYVIGSDIYGPMGDELIPFVNKDDAKVFYMDHKGVKILKFEDIKKREVYKLDE